ncbi:hypothetical protein [Dapis sp. BLCC M229]|uniref:hypothetical protein n=1 Tax=Dapis sp. BLCC M229 TaxID=3400188 RepID=UPI003CF69FA3
MAFSNFKTISEVLKTFQVTYTEYNFIREITFAISDYFREDLELTEKLRFKPSPFKEKKRSFAEQSVGWDGEETSPYPIDQDSGRLRSMT